MSSPAPAASRPGRDPAADPHAGTRDRTGPGIRAGERADLRDSARNTPGAAPRLWHETTTPSPTIPPAPRWSPLASSALPRATPSPAPETRRNSTPWTHADMSANGPRTMPGPPFHVRPRSSGQPPASSVALSNAGGESLPNHPI